MGSGIWASDSRSAPYRAIGQMIAVLLPSEPAPDHFRLALAHLAFCAATIRALPFFAHRPLSSRWYTAFQRSRVGSEQRPGLL